MSIVDDQIALYLNLATSKTRAASGDLRWLTGSAGTTLAVGASSSQETQCMVIGSAIWIANNEDVDTDFQRALLNLLGIHSHAKLAKHVEAYQTKLLPSHGGRVNVAVGSKPGEKLLAKLAKTDNGSAANEEPCVPPVGPTGGCHSDSLASPNAPEVSGIVFVKGHDEGSGGDNEHAEQKLLVALSNYLRGDGTSIDGKRVQVSGCKSACQVCGGVLTAAETQLRQGISRLRLSFDDPDLVDAHTEVGMGAAHPSGIKALDMARYFP